MERILLSAALVLACLCSSGQDRSDGQRFEINFGYGLAPVSQANRFNTGWTNYGSLASIYRPYASEVKMTGAFSAEFGYRRSPRWLTSMMISYNHVFNSSTFQSYTSENGPSYYSSMSKVNGNSLAFIPRLRYDYIVRPGFRLYSSIGIGFGFYFKYTVDDEFNYELVQPEAQLVPVGLSFGRKWFGLFETGIGTQYIGGRLGFGYRF